MLFRSNLVDNHMALVLSAFVTAGLLEVTERVIVNKISSVNNWSGCNGHIEKKMKWSCKGGYTKPMITLTGF